MRYFFTLKIDGTRKAEYIEKHRRVWDEMIAELKKAGIRNYTLFIDDDNVY
ncbi:L-rhamnose mutarotase [Thermoplasma volcanium]|uniref:L-rhamnose mutarotase n=1 Tax=Thermoplasma volcanium TaxID=50339 RepID=UPI0009FB9826|nr:L-rhamnose mutarotase [Thermoplasma volcanium]